MKMGSTFLRSKIILMGVLMVVFLSGCGTAGRSYTKLAMQETLETQILTNTSKMFVYRLKLPEDSIPNHIRIAHSSSPRKPVARGGVDINRHTYKRLQQNTGYVVQQLGYCREGFIELDRSLSRYHLWLKGECKEGASQADKERFGDKKILPVNIE